MGDLVFHCHPQSLAQIITVRQQFPDGTELINGFRLSKRQSQQIIDQAGQGIDTVLRSRCMGCNSDRNDLNNIPLLGQLIGTFGLGRYLIGHFFHCVQIHSLDSSSCLTGHYVDLQTSGNGRDTGQCLIFLPAGRKGRMHTALFNIDQRIFRVWGEGHRCFLFNIIIIRKVSASALFIGPDQQGYILGYGQAKIFDTFQSP